MWTLTIYVGYCLGMWCVISESTGFPSYEACAAERLAIIDTMQKQPSKTVLIRWSPAPSSSDGS